MCYDISFATKYELITDYVPDLVVDPQIGLDYDMNLHAQAQAFRKYPIIILEDEVKKLKAFEWGIIADYMDTPEKIKKMRNSMCNARNEKIIGDKKKYLAQASEKKMFNTGYRHI